MLVASRGQSQGLFAQHPWLSPAPWMGRFAHFGSFSSRVSDSLYVFDCPLHSPLAGDRGHGLGDVVTRNPSPYSLGDGLLNLGSYRLEDEGSQLLGLGELPPRVPGFGKRGGSAGGLPVGRSAGTMALTL